MGEYTAKQENQLYLVKVETIRNAAQRGRKVFEFLVEMPPKREVRKVGRKRIDRLIEIGAEREVGERSREGRYGEVKVVAKN